MNRTEVQSIPGFHVETIKATIALIRANVPRFNGPLDPTALVRNAGMHEQNAAVCDLLASLLEPQTPEDKPAVRPYSQPAVHQR